MTVFGTLTTEPQRGMLTYRGKATGGTGMPAGEYDAMIEDADSGWYKLGWIRDEPDRMVLFKPLYGRHWRIHCSVRAVSQFIPRPTKSTKR